MYPGSFNPPTIAHVAIAKLAIEQCGLDSLTFAVSERALAKEDVEATDRPRFSDRIEVLGQMVATEPTFELLVTPKQLIVEIAEDYEVVVMGADKWVQVQDPNFYGGDHRRRDLAVQRLPEIALIPRPPAATDGFTTLDIGPEVEALIEFVSSSRARAGDRSLMAEAALAFDDKTGAWTDPDRYEQYLVAND